MVIQCPECGEKVSDSAKKCPHCGYKLVKPRSFKGLIIALIVIIVAMIIAGICYVKYLQYEHEETAYEQILQSSDVEEVKSYLLDHEEELGSRANAVKKHLEELQFLESEWIEASEANTRSALQTFIRRHANSMHVEEAKMKIDSIDWQTARRQDTESAYRMYMNHHGDGQYYYDAEAAIDNIQQKREEEAKRQQAIDDSLDAAIEEVFQPQE